LLPHGTETAPERPKSAWADEVAPARQARIDGERIAAGLGAPLQRRLLSVRHHALPIAKQ
jgi:hypothetical protein